MGHHAGEGDTHRGDQTEKDVELPETVDSAAQQKSQSQNETAATDDFLSPETIQEIADNGREDRVHGKSHGKNSGGGAAAPAKSVEQGHVKNPERRMETTGKTKNNEGKCSDQPRCRKKTHDDR
jgi:hypothetical protein